MSFRASQGGGGQAVSSETGTPPRPHCARLLSQTRPIFPCFLFWHSSAIFCSGGIMALSGPRASYKTALLFLYCTFSFYFVLLTWFNFPKHFNEHIVHVVEDFWPLCVIVGPVQTDVITVDVFVFAVIDLLFPSAIELRFMPDPPTLNIYGIHRMNKSDNLELICRYVNLTEFNPSTNPDIHKHTYWENSLSLGWQRSAVPEVDDPSYKHSLLHQWLQWVRTLLHNTADLQCHCQWNWTVPVLLQRPESRRWQDFSSGLCLCPRYNSL